VGREQRIRTYEFKEANVSDVKKYTEVEINGLRIGKTYDDSAGELLVALHPTEAMQHFTPPGLAVDAAFTPRPVTHQGGRFTAAKAADFATIPDPSRAPGTLSMEMKYAVTSIGFMAPPRAISVPFAFEDLADADLARDLKVGGAKIAKTGLMFAKEQRGFALINNTSNVSTTYVVASAWNAAANPGDPLQGVTTAISQVHSSSGYRPNVHIIGKSAWDAIVGNANVRNGLGSYPTVDRWANYFRASYVVVADAAYNSAGEGLPGRFVPFFDDRIFCCYQDENILGPHYGLSPYWRPRGVKERFVVEDFTIFERKVDKIEVSHWEDEIVVDPLLGVLIAGINSAQ